MSIPIPMRVRQWRCPKCNHFLNRQVYFRPPQPALFTCGKCRESISCSKELLICCWQMATIIWIVLALWALLILIAFNALATKGKDAPAAVPMALMVGWVPMLIPGVIVGWPLGTYLGVSKANRLNLP